MSASGIKDIAANVGAAFSGKAARAGEAAVCASQLLIEARRQMEDLIQGCNDGRRLSLVAHKYFMPHLFKALPNTAVNPVHAAAKAALKDIAARAQHLDQG